MGKWPRLRYLESSFQPVWGWLMAAWTALSGVDTLVTHLASTQFQAQWNSYWPHWSWSIWLIVFLLLAFFGVWEGSYRHSKKLGAEIAALYSKLQEIDDAKPNIVLRNAYTLITLSSQVMWNRFRNSIHWRVRKDAKDQNAYLDSWGNPSLKRQGDGPPAPMPNAYPMAGAGARGSDILPLFVRFTVGRICCGRGPHR